MNNDEAQILIRNLIGRLVPAEPFFRLPEAILSGNEVDALRLLSGVSSDEFISTDNPTKISLDAFTKEGPPESALRLCLDFGTAMSKAWATGMNEASPIPLLMGDSESGAAVLALPSSVFISHSGRIYFGSAAETQHRTEFDASRKRFDNLKLMLSEAVVGAELDDVRLDSSIDPTTSGLTKGDMLVLYLAWLTDSAVTALQRYFGDNRVNLSESEKYPFLQTAYDINDIRYTKRRFAIPCFESAEDEPLGGMKRAEWARKTLERAVTRAQLVADTFHDKWEDLTAPQVKKVLEEIKKIDIGKLKHLLAEHAPIREPVAAGASRFSDEIRHLRTAQTQSGNAPRRYLLVIDAGAGTTDFALFQTFQAADGNIQFVLISPTTKMCRIAGNEIDRVLSPLFLKACNLDPQTGYPRESDFEIVRADLNAQIRRLKESLFTDKQVNILLRPRASGTLRLADLEADPSYQALERELKNTQKQIFKNLLDRDIGFCEIVKRANSVFDRGLPIHVLLTGGSSNLPIVRRLSAGKLDVDGYIFEMLRVNELPDSVNLLPREAAQLMANAFPQCAVAIGGSTPHLPKEYEDLTSPVTPPPPGTRILERYQVTGVG